jgi:hypothetical protein
VLPGHQLTGPSEEDDDDGHFPFNVAPLPDIFSFDLLLSLI